MFIGGDSKSVRVLLDDGIVSEVPLAEAVAVEFSSRKPPPPPRRGRPGGSDQGRRRGSDQAAAAAPVRRSPYPRVRR